MLVDLRPKNATGKRAEAALGRAYITCNKNGIPVRSGKALRHLGRPPRHAGRHDARLRRSRIPRDRRPDRRSARRPEGRQFRRRQRRRRSGGASEKVRGADRPLPDLSRTLDQDPHALPLLRQSKTRQVKDSRPTEDGAAIRRRRICPDCGGRFTTFERVQLRELMVVKKIRPQGAVRPRQAAALGQDRAAQARRRARARSSA